MVVEFERAIDTLDTKIFEAIDTQTTEADRDSLLAIHRAVRREGDYCYLEIGSHLGGTIVPHLLDTRCKKIYSIDSRPFVALDVREDQLYPDNSTGRMMQLLSNVAPDQMVKVQTFDMETSQMDPDWIATPPTLCFIDGEHTNEAVVRDFEFVRKVVSPSGTIAFHDSNLVYKGIRKIIADLKRSDTPHVVFKVGGSVLAIGFNGSPIIGDSYLNSLKQHTEKYFLRSAVRLRLRRFKINRKKQFKR